VYKTVSGAGSSSFGCRESYLIGGRIEFGRLADLLIPFLVTRQLVCGAGAVVPTASGAMYCLSRPVVVDRTRPFINTRDEARAAATGGRRLHVMISDPAMSETTTLLKAGATALVLRMAEAGTVLPDLTLSQPVQAIGEISQDVTGQRPVPLADGRQMGALGIQRLYLAEAKNYAGQHGAGAIARRVLGLWERALDAIAAGDLDAVAGEIDWVMKSRLIEQHREASDLPLEAPHIAAADLAYHDINQSQGLYYQLARGNEVARTARDIDIFEAKTVPPPAGRYRQAG